MLLVLSCIICALGLAKEELQSDSYASVLQKHSISIISWIKSHNGYLHPSLEMRHSDPSDPTSLFGMFTNTEIDEGTLLFRVPKEVILHSTDAELRQLDCGLVRVLLDEMKNKDVSKYAPFLNYLLDTQPPGQLPSAWSDAGKEMLMKALGDEEFSIVKAKELLSRYKVLGQKNTLPPEEPISWVYQEWYHDCNGGKDDLEEYAAMLVLQRSWDNILIPLYDMLNHRNGAWLNTRTSGIGVHGNGSVEVYASRDIYDGEQIYSSYNMCEDCSARINTYGTPEIFRDYGFLEDMPQTWIFSDIGLGFTVDELEEPDENGNPQYNLMEWINNDMPNETSIIQFEEKLEYIHNRLDSLVLRQLWIDVPEFEWIQVVNYLTAMERSIQMALQWYDEMTHDSNFCVLKGTCVVDLGRYRDLDEHYRTTLNRSYPDASCDLSKEFEVFMDGTFEEVDSTKSHYQTINFLVNAANMDTCMDLDDTVQICTSYRPHYHEYMVHQTARFLPKDSIKRVLFVGGGDSMLLHEALKYPSLELVVGLELDQKVTRGCFKHFGTQPHFDDSRVEWWFGDASKTLLMLPKDYFASFDLVLVDLSETVMSFSVTHELNVIEALTLLVKPDGIFVKNEVYFDELKDIFPYTALITWQDNPVICAQVMVMASRTVDFMNPSVGPTLTEHSVDLLVVQKIVDESDHFELYHDYSFNATSAHLCESYIEGLDLSTTQNRSPGIMMVVEVESVKGEFLGMDVLTSITRTLEEKGFTTLSSEISTSDSSSVFYVVLKEGYVISRVLADHRYIGLDLHLWSSMDKQKDVMEALVEALGGDVSNVSSYRVITGGMFGLETWRIDEKLRGPQLHEFCDKFKKTSPLVKKYEGIVSESDIFTAMELGLALLGRDELKVALLVGTDQEMTNKSKRLISEFKAVSDVVLLECPSMHVFNKFSENATHALTACEKNIYDTLSKGSQENEFDALLIDPSADKSIGSIMLELFSRHAKLIFPKILKVDSLVITTEHDKQVWRKHMLLLMKDKAFSSNPDAAFADISFANIKGESQIKLLVTNYGIKDFANRLNATLVEFNTENDHIHARIEVMNGGEWTFQEDFKPSRIYLHKDYNQTDSLSQWMSQVPLGHQTIVQIEPNPSSQEKKQIISQLLLTKATNAAINGMNIPGLKSTSIKKFCNLGEGCLYLALFDAGSFVVLWDGRSHIDIVIFTYKEDLNIPDEFVRLFLENIPTYTIMLRDEQPRGSGRLVSYSRDLEEGILPPWVPPEMIPVIQTA